MAVELGCLRSDRLAHGAAAELNCGRAGVSTIPHKTARDRVQFCTEEPNCEQYVLELASTAMGEWR